jgi:hypothetical protein
MVALQPLERPLSGFNERLLLTQSGRLSGGVIYVHEPDL